MMRFVLTILLFVIGLPTWASDRVALLIGNSQYDNALLSLKNPTNDVAAMAKKLGNLGFVVITTQDASREDMERALAAFEKQLNGAELGLFFFAGHGSQAAGENYLLGTKFDGTSSKAVKDASLTLSAVRGVFARARPRAGIVILDACRDNPLNVAGTASGPGLARTATGAGVLIAYATDPGNVAFEGTGDNSIFTTALLKHIAEPGLDVRLMFGRVRQDVVLNTRGAQVPWVEESLLGEHTLNPALNAAGREAMVARDIATWRVVSSKTTPEAYRSYLEEFPNGMFKDFAQDRVDRLSYVAAQAATQSPSKPTELDLTQEPSRIASALSVLGFTSRSRTLEPTLDELELAAAAYRDSLGINAALTNENLFADASRLLLYLGASVGKQIRVDIAALKSIDQTLVVARDAFAELEEIAKDDPNAQPILDQAREDIKAIERAQTEVLAQLDQTRAYYEELMDRASRDFPEYMTERTLGVGATRSAPSSLETGAPDRARLFLKHVAQETNPETKGTYQWLADFLPQG
ncbi:MAG: caspase family protein [Pseudomonadota bacterium]